MDDVLEAPDFMYLTCNGKGRDMWDENGIKLLDALRLDDSIDFEDKVYNYVNECLVDFGYV